VTTSLWILVAERGVQPPPLEEDLDLVEHRVTVSA
jgi:hypothetical protein